MYLSTCNMHLFTCKLKNKGNGVFSIPAEDIQMFSESTHFSGFKHTSTVVRICVKANSLQMHYLLPVNQNY